MVLHKVSSHPIYFSKNAQLLIKVWLQIKQPPQAAVSDNTRAGFHKWGFVIGSHENILV